ncbi:MAG TPA: NAD(P)H-quinone oxidoreductase [Kofleriaceae bacterium]|nr:NAD(P)H-quinone oxidoreductase [Kofleriaceae bacterium]
MNPHGSRAVVLRGAGDVDVMHVEDVARPTPGAGEVLVEVAAAGLNRADILQRRGFYPAPPGAPRDIPGLEVAGTVVELGDGVLDVAVGDRVMAICAGGGMATHIALHARTLVRVPASLDLARAAAVPEVFMSAFDALTLQAGLGMGEVVLVHAVGSGVGTAAVQLAARAGARAIGTSRTADKLERCAALGMADGVLVDKASFAARVRELTSGRGADVILDCVGAAYLEENVRALAPRGRIVVVGLLGGVSGQLPLGALLAARGRVQGTVLRSRPLEEKAVLAQSFAAQVLPLLADGRLVPVVDAVMPMTEVREAHRRMERNETFGKIVLAW